MHPTRVAIIGCGQIAVAGHLPAFAAAAHAGLCQVVGVGDVSRVRAEAAARPYDIAAFTGVDELLHRTQPTVVCIATPPSSHHDLVLQALDAGCHVLCEKPVAMNLSEATAMVTAAAHAGRVLSICFQYRYWDESV